MKKEAAAHMIESRMDENQDIETGKEIFSEFVRDWFYGYYQSKIKETTLSNRACLLERHILQNNLLVNKMIIKITPSDIDNFYNQKIKENYSTSYIRQMHQLLNLAFKQAVELGEIVSNPVSDTDPPLIREIAIWSCNEINIFLKTCRGR